jgi:uncharacterized protein YkuJ
MSSTITDAVAARIAAISPEVNNRVVDHLVNIELEKRTNAIVDVMSKLRDLQNDLKKIKPDLGGYFQEDGTEVKPVNYSKDKFEARKKLIDQIEKYEKALDLAIDKGDMSKLYDLKK